MTFIDIQQVSLRIPHLEKPILSDISYQVTQGDFIIILGSNGSGKSSLLKLLDRRYSPTAGNIYLNQKPLAQFSTKEWSQTVITLTQNYQESLFPSLTLLENYLLVKQRQTTHRFSLRQKKNREFFAEYLSQFNANLPHKLDQVVERLSGGEKQALALALSVLYPPQVLLLDEHTSALDPKSALQLMSITQRIVSQHHITCILTTHDLDIALEYGNRVLALRQGKTLQIIDHVEKSKLNQKQLLAACY